LKRRRNRRDGVQRQNLAGSVDASLRLRFIELAKEAKLNVSEALEAAVKAWVQRRKPKAL
jgi:post-segregation antitoxin (ccd killing protein)